jgi:prepilin-type N-terminal cleavage/methylation domain-containing protein
MSRYVTRTREQAGFSLFELMVVISVGFILAAMSIPRMSNVIAMMKLRSSMTTASSFFQNQRMLAVKKNATIKSDHTNRTTPPYSLVYWAKDYTDSSALNTHDPQVEMEAPIYAYDTPTGAGAPSAIPNGTLGLLSNPETTDPLFNSRGLPCKINGINCDNAAFIKYYQDTRSKRWAAVSITPAGRIKRWFWTGSAWTD